MAMGTNATVERLMREKRYQQQCEGAINTEVRVGGETGMGEGSEERGRMQFIACTSTAIRPGRRVREH